MKKKFISLIASLSIAFGLSASAFSKDLSHQEKRVQQYKQFYKEYNDKDYKLKKSGEVTGGGDGKIECYDYIEIMYGNNLYDNIRSRFMRVFDSYAPEGDKEGDGFTWYFRPYTPMGVSEKAIPIEQIAKEDLPQVMKDVLTLPEDLQKKIIGIAHYLVDGDFWIMLPSEKGAITARKMYDHLNKLDEWRDAKQKDSKGQIQPIISTENQLLPFDIFFPNILFVDEDKDGKLDYAVERYCTDGNWFEPGDKQRYITLTKWFELDKNSETGRARKYDSPSRIFIDFDRGKEYEQDGFDIEFCDEEHDGYFEKYKLVEKETK